MTQAPMTNALPKTYRPDQTESRVWSRWIETGAFHADPANVASGQAKPFCIVIPPPNVTAALHLGHALNNTIQDILVRAHRMRGREACWIPGTDHAGIATQTVVDRRLKEAGEPALADYKQRELAGQNGREQFIRLVQDWKDEYERRITDQLRAMGCSCDWPRQRFTMDAVCARAVREAFFRLFKDGLIYRGKRLVNWDPVTQTALADDEVESREIDGAFYYLRYPLVRSDEAHDLDNHAPVTWGELAAAGYPGAEAHADDGHAWVTVATTRPETYLGDTAVAMNPADPRARYLKLYRAQLPLVGRVVPIIEDDYVVLPDPESGGTKARFATGFLKVTPAHDPNDWEIGRRHGLDVINVMAPDASISDRHGWSDVGDAHLFVGLSREDARKKVVAEFQARNIGEEPLLEDIRPHRHSVGHSYRSHAAIEPYLSDQWYCKVTDDRLRGHAQRALVAEQRTPESQAAWPASRPNLDGAGDAGDGSMRFYPTRYAKTYEHWHDELRDWCISRQLWWGHRIPVWSASTDVTDTQSWRESWGRFVFGQSRCESRPDTAVFRAYTLDDGATLELNIGDEPPIQNIDRPAAAFVCLLEDDSELINALETRGFRRDPDVLDTWFSSALWPLSTMGWPDPARAASETGVDDMPAMLGAFNPTSVLCTAREIITLWVSRMAMFNRYFLGEGADGRTPGPVPFHDVFVHAMIQDGEGRKMSKSLGNGVDPLDIIDSHGADALRFTLAHMTTQTQDVRMPVERDPETGKNTSPKFDAGRNLCNKLWNASRFALAILEKTPPGDQPVDAAASALVDRWMLARLARAQRDIDAALSEYRFHEYAQTAWDILWRDFCDWYLEAVKPTVADDPAQRGVLRAALDTILRLLHPIAPFITEEIFAHLRAVPAPGVSGLTHASTRDRATHDPTHDPAHDPATLCVSGWPRLDDALVDEQAEAAFGRVQDIVRAVREVRAQMEVAPRRRITLHASPELLAEIRAGAGLVETLAGLATVTTEPAPPASAAFTLEGAEHRLSDLADAVDVAAERERLARKLAELDKSITALDARLANPGYTDKAPAHLVEQTRAQHAQLTEERDATRTALDALAE